MESVDYDLEESEDRLAFGHNLGTAKVQVWNAVSMNSAYQELE